MNKEMNRELNSFRGFTLIELLAVIVVLAIIILIAVQAVLPQMDRAQRSVFAIEANGAIQAAQTYYTTGKIMGDGIGDTLPVDEDKPKCVTIDDLIDQGFSELEKDTYQGQVQVVKHGDLYYYRVYLEKNNEYMIVGEGVDTWPSPSKNIDIDLSMVKDYNLASEGTVDNSDRSHWKEGFTDCTVTAETYD